MAGVKGKSGGARPGAGRKPKEKPGVVPVEGVNDMLELLQQVALGRVEANALQVRAAIAAVQYTHMKKGDGGKKDEAADRARKAAGKFGATAPPRLAAANGKKV